MTPVETPSQAQVHNPLTQAEREQLARLMERHLKTSIEAAKEQAQNSPHPSDEQVAAEAGVQSSVNDKVLAAVATPVVPLTPEQAGVAQPSQLSAVNDPSPESQEVAGNLNQLEARLSTLEKEVQALLDHFA